MASEIGTRIRLARERLQWSQQQLADATGVDVKTVRNWEKTGRIRNRRGAIEAVLSISLDSEPDIVRPSETTDEALDQLAEFLDRLREERRQGKESNGHEGNGTHRAGLSA